MGGCAGAPNVTIYTSDCLKRAHAAGAYAPLFGTFVHCSMHRALRLMHRNLQSLRALDRRGHNVGATGEGGGLGGAGRGGARGVACGEEVRDAGERTQSALRFLSSKGVIAAARQPSIAPLNPTDHLSPRHGSARAAARKPQCLGSDRSVQRLRSKVRKSFILEV